MCLLTHSTYFASIFVPFSPINRVGSRKKNNQHCLEVIQYLLKTGADINAQDDILRYSPLIYATVKNNVESLEILLQNGANPNLRSLTGRSPLNYAIEEKFQGCIILLLEEGEN